MNEGITNIDGYLELLKHLSPANKLQLISKLKKSLHTEIDTDASSAAYYREREFMNMNRSQEYTRNIDEL